MILLKSLFNYHQVGRLIHFKCESIVISIFLVVQNYVEIGGFSRRVQVIFKYT